MKTKKTLSLITSAIIAVSSISFTAFITSADDNFVSLDYKNTLANDYKMGFSNQEEIIPGNYCIDEDSQGYYFYLDNYDTYIRYENKGLVDGYDEAFFENNSLLVNWLSSYHTFENMGITKNKDNETGTTTIIIDYKYYADFVVSPIGFSYDIDVIEFKKSDVLDVDFSKLQVNITETYSNATPIVPDQNIPDDKTYTKNLTNIIFNDAFDYKSTISTVGNLGLFKTFIKDNTNDKNYYAIIDNYEDYNACGFTGKSKEFFKDHVLLVICMYNSMCACDVYTNTGITRNDDNTLNVTYSAIWDYPRAFIAEYVIDTIEINKSDIKNIDFTKLNVNVGTKYIEHSEENNNEVYVIGLVGCDINYIDLSRNINKLNKTTTPTTQKPTTPTVKKPTKVTKVKLKSTKKKQLKVTWKKIKGTKYQVQYSLKKNMKNAKTKKNIKKNSVTLKKLKSNKKYYVRVRAYKTVNGKKYFGKWSNKAVKVVK